jgi:hypothetical protein
MWLALDPGAMYEYEPNAYGSTVHLWALQPVAASHSHAVGRCAPGMM